MNVGADQVEEPELGAQETFELRRPRGLRALHYSRNFAGHYPETQVEALHELGDVVRTPFPFRGIAFFHPRHVKHVLRNGVLNYPKSHYYEALRPILGNGLFLSDGDLWTRQRKILAPEFRAEPVRRFLPGMVACLEEMFALWDRSGGQPRAVSDDFLNLTLWIVGGAMFQSGFRAEAEIIGKALETCLAQATVQLRTGGLLRPWMPTPGNLRYKRAERQLNRVVREVIARGRGNAAGKHDVLSRLLAHRDEVTGRPMDEHLLVDEVKSLILAGHETTSLALSWSYYLLAQHPEIEERLHRESAEVLDRYGPTVDAIPHLEYARRVFLETMRLYPPVPGLSRGVHEDEEIDGIRVRRGEVVFISPYATHRHPRCWDRPEAFDPDRFAPDRVDKIVPFSYMPFLLGRRACLGEHFGMLEGTIALAMIASRYKLELATRIPIRSRPIATLRLARPLVMRAIPR